MYLSMEFVMLFKVFLVFFRVKIRRVVNWEEERVLNSLNSE